MQLISGPQMGGVVGVGGTVPDPEGSNVPE